MVFAVPFVAWIMKVCNKMGIIGYTPLPVKRAALVWDDENKMSASSELLVSADNGANRVSRVFDDMGSNQEVKRTRQDMIERIELNPKSGLNESFHWFLRALLYQFFIREEISVNDVTVNWCRKWTRQCTDF